MALPGKFHTNILIDSRSRITESPAEFTYVLDSGVQIPSGTTAFVTCTRWTVDTSRVPDRADRIGQSLQLLISDIGSGGDVIDAGIGGAPVPCVAYIDTIDNARNVAFMSSLTAHPMTAVSGLNMRRFNVSVRFPDGSLADLRDPITRQGGEWEADLMLVIYTPASANR